MSERYDFTDCDDELLDELIDFEPRVDLETLEGFVTEIVRTTGLSHPVDAFVLARLLNVRLIPVGGSTSSENVDSREIRYGIKGRDVLVHGGIAHGCGHIVLADNGRNHRDEAAASYLAGALRLHRQRYLDELAATNWDLDALAEMHPMVSRQALVVRMTQVSSATSSVWDSGKLTKVYGNGEHDVEAARALVDEVLGTERPIRGGATSAWPVFDGAFRRVIVVGRAA